MNETDIIKRIESEHLSIEVTTECNSECDHCFVKGNSGVIISLTPGEIKEIIDEGYGLGYRNLHITGGEPFLWEHLPDTVEYTLDKGYDTVFINSNGTLLDAEKCNDLKKYEKKIKLTISLHGDEIIHNFYRGKGAYSRALTGIKNCHDAGIPFQIFTTAGKKLIEKLPDFAVFIFNEFPEISAITLIQLINMFEDSDDMKNDLLSPDDFISLVQTTALLNLNGFNIEILENPLANVVAYLYGLKLPAHSNALQRPGRIIVMADKRMAPAHSTRDYFGKYSPGKLKEVLYSEEYMNAVGADKMTCPECKHYFLCRDNGMIRPSEEYRDLNTRVPYCVRVIEKAMG